MSNPRLSDLGRGRGPAGRPISGRAATGARAGGRGEAGPVRAVERWALRRARPGEEGWRAGSGEGVTCAHSRQGWRLGRARVGRGERGRGRVTRCHQTDPPRCGMLRGEVRGWVPGG